MNRLNKILSNSQNTQSGATLLFTIILIVVLSVVGVGMFSLIWTSQFNQVEAQKSAKAYYLSESCLRIAAGEYKHSASKNTTLVMLHNKTFTMPDGQGNCSMEIYPYWLYATANYTAGANPIVLYMPGAVPPVDENSSSQIALTAASVSVNLRTTNETAVASNASIGSFNAGAGGTPVTFTLSTPFTGAIAVGNEFYIGYNYTSSTVVASAGGDLVLNINAADTSLLTAYIFPPEKGSIFVESSSGLSQYRYDKRIIHTDVNPDTVTLTNIQAIIGATYTATFPLTINNTPIYMAKSLALRSESDIGN